jgi:glutathione S-transferase
MMTLVGQYDSPFVRRVAITLHLYGMPFQRNAMSVFSDAGAMAKINPIIRIPSLILDDGGVLIDSSAIIDYLDGLAGPERSLTPPSGNERQMVLQIMAYATGVVDKLGTIVYERTFHPPEHVSEDWMARCRRQLEGALSVLEGLSKEPYFLGDRMSQADVTMGVAMGYMKIRPEYAPAPGSYPGLEALAERLEALDAFKAALPSDKEVMPSTPSG